jgi:two-component sensor histidine kinase
LRAPTHPQQRKRLETLRSYRILDTPREQDFDEIVNLASRICETSISVINLIDETRQWFKAEVGLNARETPLETSICSHIILDNDFVEITDTLADPRMADNPLCLAEDGLRFYAGARLLAPNGLPIGTLCVLDTEPRSLNDLQRETLRVLSRQVMKQLELRLALHNQRILRAEMDHRVKNSLQSVGAIVRIYGRAIQDDQGKAALDAIQRRIEAMAALHRQLQELEDGDALQSIDMKAYLADIGNHLETLARDDVALSITAADIALKPRQATSIGMIVSEFAANAMKHGFPDGRSGTIEVSLRHDNEGHCTLACTDDGIGLNTEKPQDKAHGIGMSLLEAAASQLGGTLTSEVTHNGGRLSVSFAMDDTA